MIVDRAQFRVDIRPGGLVLVALLARKVFSLGRRRHITVGIAGLGEAATTLGWSIPPPWQRIPALFSRGLALAYALIVCVFVTGQSRGNGTEAESNAKSDFRLAEHCRISCFVDRLSASYA